jgi:hypothetical protein
LGQKLLTEFLTLVEQLGADAIQTVVILFLLWQKMNVAEEVAKQNADKLTRIETLMEERKNQ